MIKALLFAVILLWIMVFVVIPGVPEAAGWFELLFVNVLGMPYNSGLLIYLLIIFGGLAYGIHYSPLEDKQGYLNFVLTSLLVVMIGYSSLQ